MKQRRTVYVIENMRNGRIYVGCTIDVRARWATHRRALRRNYHVNRHLQADWRRYGEEAFAWHIVTDLPCAPRQAEARLILELCAVAYNTSAFV
jgi:hypothetical protein